MLSFTIHSVLLLHAAAIALASIRLARGPGLVDRLTALEFIIMCCIAVLALEVLRTGQVSLLAPALVLALVGIVGTVAFLFHTLQENSNR
ncbi:MAG: monovalent cation/H+ antiporter complex subunit F [Candidatus Hydrogenedentota bacterium]